MSMLSILGALAIATTPPVAAPAEAGTDAKTMAACAPADYAAALDCLDRHLAAADKETLKKEGTAMAHFGLGMWIRNNWGLWKGGALRQSLQAHGLLIADDMSGVILDGYVARLRGEPSTLKDQLAVRAARRKG